ncbi:hypothetical protein E4U55_007128 [Claviceps digitariae]|nr:hypothetical protein E4U55_007128 [Claviceps digitariae]
MQFSASAALAAVAIFAGQTLGECGVGYPPQMIGRSQTDWCHARSDIPYFYNCNLSGGTVLHVGNWFALTAGSPRGTYLQIYCGVYEHQYWCSPGDHGNFQFDCGDQPAQVYETIFLGH